MTGARGSSGAAAEGLQRTRIRVHGIVQGVGFRPFVYRIAHRHNLTGWVLNDTLGVLAEVEGNSRNVSSLLKALRREAPPIARIEGIEKSDVPLKHEKGFRILKSAACEGKEPVIPPDIATCTDCLREIFDSADRRYRYPFTNCTNCGPRYTIVKDTPYDRPRTSMCEFKMCPLCQKEYDNPEDRRFHAQPNACAVCGPELTLKDSRGGIVTGGDPLQRTIELLHRGAIVAIKGLGGFHLACDALSDAPVRKLRERKKRPYKPLAVMSQDVEAVAHYAVVSKLEQTVLESYASPIVLLRKRNAKLLSELVAPGISDIGAMLPYTPLHHLILRDNFAALVMTSGNLTDEPTIASNEIAFEKLSGIADYFLLHNREILIQNDDSIIKVIRNEPVLMRRARGYVPDSVKLPGVPRSAGDILAVGGEEKGTVCFVKNGRAFLSQHLGDLKNRESILSFENTVSHIKKILKVKPEIIAHDIHPSYSSTKYALRQRGVQTVAVQHHFAHIAACLAENGVNRKVVGISLDGVGLGTDGKTWGGEFLVADLSGFRRAGHLRYVRLPGGDAAAKEPYRMAVSYLYTAFDGKASDLAVTLLKDAPKDRIGIVLNMLEKRINSPLTSSTGRLFDAVASLVGLCHINTYEGQAPMELESLIWRTGKHDDTYPGKLDEQRDGIVIDTVPLIQSIVRDIERGRDKGYISCKFHNTVAQYALDVCRRIREIEGITCTALSGGVFQNKYLTEKLVALLEEEGFTVYSHKLVPPNDGCISLGQVAVAAHRQSIKDR